MSGHFVPLVDERLPPKQNTKIVVVGAHKYLERIVRMGLGVGATLSIAGLVFFGTITSLAAKIGAHPTSLGFIRDPHAAISVLVHF